MAIPYVGEIRMFGGAFSPRGWAFCDGRELAIAANRTLFDLIGTTYGGDGTSTFKVPDLRGRVPLNNGTRPPVRPDGSPDSSGGSSAFPLGKRGGSEEVSLPPETSHTHSLLASEAAANVRSPVGNALAKAAGSIYTTTLAPDRSGNLSFAPLAESAVGESGSSSCSLYLKDRSADPGVNTLRVLAKSQDIVCKIEDGTVGGSFKLTASSVQGGPQEIWDNLKLADAASLANVNQNSKWVKLTDLKSATAAPNNNPRALAATTVTGAHLTHTNMQPYTCVSFIIALEGTHPSGAPDDVGDPILGEIRMFPYGFQDPNWAPCDGRQLSITNNTALFPVLGTYYGGSGGTTFAVPNIPAGAVPMFWRQGPGLSNRNIGERGGVPTVPLEGSQVLPEHTHQLRASTAPGDTNIPDGAFTGTGSALYAPPNSLQPMAQALQANPASSATDPNKPHNNMMPYLTVYFCICISVLEGAGPDHSDNPLDNP